MNKPVNIRVLIVDDHAVVRSGLCFFLQTIEDIHVVGEATDGEQAIQMCEDLLPDVILMDIVMPMLDGIAATARIYERWPHIHIIALSSFQEQDLVQRILRAGATAYLLKNVQAHDLAEAIRAAVAGQSTMPLEVTRTLLKPGNQPAPLAPDLSPREQEVLALMVEGLRNDQIAERLTVSRNTVRYHVHNILAKLGATNRTEAVSLAMSHHLLS